MKKPLIILFLLIMGLSVIFAVCIRNKNDPDRALNYLKDLDSYSSDVTIQIKNDKQNIEYKTRQFYNKKYGYRLELGEDRVMIYKENKIEVKDIKNGLQYSTDKDFDSVYKLSFISEYVGLIYTNEKIGFSEKELNGEKFQVIELVIPGMNRNIKYAELYTDIKSNIPRFLLIYDDKNREKMRVTYNNFVPNAEINKELF